MVSAVKWVRPALSALFAMAAAAPAAHAETFTAQGTSPRDPALTGGEDDLRAAARSGATSLTRTARATIRPPQRTPEQRGDELGRGGGLGFGVVPGGEDARAGGGDRDRELEVGGQRAVL